MLLNEIYTQVTEGVNDPAIFKVIFFIGSPGSGKSRVERQLGLKTMGFVSLDLDVIFSRLLTKHGLSLKMPPEEAEPRAEIRSIAKQKLAKKQEIILDGRLGVVIQGTGHEMSKIHSVRSYLHSLGYEDALVVVHSHDVNTALARNLKRPRSIPPEEVIKRWDAVTQQLDQYKKEFPFHFVIHNDEDIPSTSYKRDIAGVYVKLFKWSRKIPKNQIAQDWIRNNQ